MHADDKSEVLRRARHFMSRNLHSRTAGRNVRPHDLLHIVRAVKSGRSRWHISVSLHASCGDNQVEIVLEAVSRRIGPNQSRLQQLSSHGYRDSLLLTFPCIEGCVFVEETYALANTVRSHHRLQVHAAKAF